MESTRDYYSLHLSLFYLLITLILQSQHTHAAEVCPDGWEPNPTKTKCFLHIATPHSWNESEFLCNKDPHHSHLAVLTSIQELTLLQKLCQAPHSHGCWIGRRSMSNSPSNNGLGWNWSVDTAPPWGLLDSSFNISNGSSNHTDSCALVVRKSSTVVSTRCKAYHESICMFHIENRCRHHHCHKEYFISLLSVSGFILCTTLAVVIWLLTNKRSKRRKRSRKASNPSSVDMATPSWKVFSNEELRSITKNFSEVNRLIGDAKTAGTYSGVLPDGSRVAVKRLKRSSFQRRGILNVEETGEVSDVAGWRPSTPPGMRAMIGRVARLYHPNLVAIRGCRYDHGDRYIVYEYVVNGPLDGWLYRVPRGGRTLDWAMRMRIATTLAQGIAFLHDKVKPHVVHQDICASNVLLDEDFGAHLMGVGLSKFVPWEVMHERTVMAAKYGYLAPEFVYKNELTTKSDVYSFGVLLLEIVSGRRPTQQVDSVGGWQMIFEWATPLVQSHCYLDLLDPVISDVPELGVIQKVVELVYSCTQHVPSVRPRMSHVVHQLQQFAFKSGSEKARTGSSTSTGTSTATPVSAVELEANNV